MVLLLGACTDLPTAPEVDNPYDPEFTGTRIPSAPSHLELSRLSNTEGEIRWRDNSSIERGYAVTSAVWRPGSLSAEHTFRTTGPNGSRVLVPLPLNTDSVVVFVTALSQTYPNSHTARRTFVSP